MIEWIFNNIPLIIVILGGLLSLFNKSGERDTSTPPIRPLPKEAKLEKQPMEPKNESPFEMIQQEVEKRFKPQAEMDQTAPDLDKITRQLEKAEQILQENLQSKEEEYKRQMEQLETHLSKKQALASKINIPRVSKTTVIEGVIWSEILGPPRAKKTHFNSSYRK